MKTDRFPVRLAMIGALALALTVAGCGRKGPLDPPPNAKALAEEPGPLDDPTTTIEADPRAPDNPVAPRGQKRRIILDRLID